MQVITRDDVDHVLTQIETDGYAVLRGVVSKPLLAEFNKVVLDEFEGAKESGRLFKGGGMTTGHLNCFPGRPGRFLYDEIRNAGLLEVVRAWNPAAVDRARATLNLNLPGSVAQHYHMDDLYTEPFLICNVAVVDTDLQNGAFDVLPGTNREFYKFWRYALERKYKLSTRVPLDQGDVLFRLSTTWHRGTPNRSGAPRPMAAITFGERGAPDGDPFEDNEGRTVFYPNWYKTTRLGRFRESVYVRAPITYSVYRFVRSLYGNKGYSSY